ncbi:VTT domain-containing protein [Altericroceibacterium xinjiangense]|uniref:VTT domain-containing protein n=1 Tax=Altericroceibacterium xinjiangense TaxID=762261 RepID=UPI000F7E6978|nr:VTT domain-containing protein [Altericroceibacterium xinjiangense]
MGFTETVLGWADTFPWLADLLQNPLLLAMGITMLTTALVAACVPGVIIPLAFSSGVLLGGWAGMLVVVTGALLGSQLLFLLARYSLRDRVHAKLGSKLDRFDEHFADRGIFYIIGLRIAGAPHFLVTGASALTPVRAGPFALATLLGFLPIIAFTATAASAI